MTTYSGARIVLACALTLSLFCPARVRGGEVGSAWNPSPDEGAAGYNLYYGLNSGDYTSSVDVQTNLTATIAGLTPGLTYYFAVTAYDTNGDESVDSNEVTNRLPILPQIMAQPLTQTAVAGAPVTLSVSACGDPPLSFQWVNGLAPIPGATNSLLSWPHISDGNAGIYTVIVSNPWGATTSSVAALTVLDPPAIITQPQSRTVIATTAASFSSAATGTAPLSLQWCHGTTAISQTVPISKNGNVPLYVNLYIRGLTGLQTFTIGNQTALTSVNASGCTSLTSLSCNYFEVGTIINAGNCTSLTSLSNITSDATVPIQNAIIATLPAFASGTHTLHWSSYAPANPAGDDDAVAKGWTVNRSGG